MSTLLPTVTTPDDYWAVHRESDRFRPAIEHVCRAHGLDALSVEPMPRASQIVFGAGDAVIKMFPPPFAGEASVERLALGHVQGRLPVPTPAVIADGELEGWTYIVMARLAGVPLRDAWDGMAPGERIDVVTSLGQAVAAMHALPTTGLEAITIDWPTFLHEQASACVAHQRAQELDEHCLARIGPFLADVLPELHRPFRPALLHTEIMRDHVLVERSPGGPRITGLFDFEPAMVGDPGYELASVGLFVAQGDASILRAYLSGYGIDGAADPREMQRQAMAFTLLHRYSRLSWYLTFMPPVPADATLEELASRWWSTA